MTVSELKAFIEGVEVGQNSDWSPNRDEWKAIKEKIELLKITTSVEFKYRDSFAGLGGKL